jgi:nucleoside-diphosphate-sugar epimerase
VLAPALLAAGHEVVGLDSGLYEGCALGPEPVPIATIKRDVRDVAPDDLHGFDAVLHLAAISNDPVGDLDPEVTYEVNYRASVRLAELARAAGVGRFLFSSSCSLYGAAGDAVLDESAEFSPVTAYAHSKVLAEQEIAELADDRFSPTFLRNATVYGVSPRLRADLVVNNLVGNAVTTGEVLIMSDGTPWRPLVHVRDVSHAFIAALEAQRDAVHNEAFNVGADGENYQIRDVAAIVEEVVDASVVTYAPGGGPDIRNYRVSFAKFARAVPAFEPSWDVRKGVQELYAAFREHGLTQAAFSGSRFVRLLRIRELMQEGQLDAQLRIRDPDGGVDAGT